MNEWIKYLDGILGGKEERVGSTIKYVAILSKNSPKSTEDNVGEEE